MITKSIISEQTTMQSVTALVPDELPLLLGHLVQRRRVSGTERGRPYIVLEVHCPWDKHRHEFEIKLIDPDRLDALLPVELPCGRIVRVGIDLENNLTATRKLIAKTKADFKRWSVEHAINRGLPLDRLEVLALRSE